MSQLRFAAFTLALVGAIVLAATSTALAVFPGLSTDLTGAAIDGVTPQGAARIDQSSFPGTLEVRVSRVNLPDGTTLTVVISDCVSFGSPNVGTFTIAHGRARFVTTLPAAPSVCQVGRNSSITVNTDDGTVILRGGAPWTVR